MPWKHDQSVERSETRGSQEERLKRLYTVKAQRDEEGRQRDAGQNEDSWQSKKELKSARRQKKRITIAECETPIQKSRRLLVRWRRKEDNREKEVEENDADVVERKPHFKQRDAVKNHISQWRSVAWSWRERNR